MMQYLSSKNGLTIIINSSRLAHAFRNEQRNTIVYLGGEYRPYRTDIVGPLAEIMIENLRGYKAFTGADGIDIELGLSANDITSARIAQKILNNAAQVIFIGDHSKTSIDTMLNTMQSSFTISPLLLLPPVLVIVMVVIGKLELGLVVMQDALIRSGDLAAARLRF